MASKHFAGSPLLYIQQPTISTPVAPMQHNYFTPKHHQNSPEQKDKKHTRTVPLKRNHAIKLQDVVEEVLEKEPSEELSEQSKFKDMSIKQKVSYFINRPDHAPTIKCEMKTNEKKYYGVITGFENEQVFIRVGRRSSSSEIPLSDITDIRIIGF